MPRRPRIHLPGVPIHLVQRGHNREACFFTDEDFLAYREWLAEALKKSGCALHAYVLMTHHVHLLLTPHPLFLGLDKDAQDRQAVYRALFRPELEQEALADIRLALNQGQPLGNGRFLDQVERMLGRRCEVRPRGRPRKSDTSMKPAGQQS